MDKKIGQILLNGGSIKELRKAFPDFPKEPTKESFMKLGYKESTAKKYIFLLNKNSKVNSTKKKSTVSNKKRANSTAKPISSEVTKFIASERADYKNLLVDTCSLGYSETLQLIEDAEHVTFIYSIIEEMDKKSKCNGTNLASNIRLYYEKILSNPEKYMLSIFSGCNNESYPDNILLQYIMMLPKPIRPTLLTVDKNLALKAKALDLQYILYLAKTSKQHEKPKNEKRKKLGYGVYLITTEDGMFAEYNGPFALYIIHDKEEIKVSANKVPVISGDILCLKQKCKKELIERKFQI